MLDHESGLLPQDAPGSDDVAVLGSTCWAPATPRCPPR